MELKQTPLNALHRERGGRMVPFAGWEMPVQYTSILEEHSRVRSSAGIFDVSHMGQFRLEGDDSAAFLDFTCSAHMSGAEIGAAKYAILCNETGGAIDDLIVYRLSEKTWLLIVNASNIDKDFDWLTKHSEQFSVELENVSDDWALIALQGPEVIRMLEARSWGFPKKRFQHAEFVWDGTQIRVCRTGYTGEDGVECLVRADQVLGFVASVEDCLGEVAWCGLGARDSLRLEAGLPLYGHELTDEFGPLEARMKWAVDFSKTDFLGKAAMEARLESSERRIIRLFAMQDRRIARAGTPIVDTEGREVGEVLSGSLAPSLQCGIGSAVVPFGFKEAAYVSIRGKSLPIAWKKSLL
ncbi:MAG: glycine cleavage system aminomethyltransferase GcvT [Verrucomicrobiota bacterium]